MTTILPQSPISPRKLTYTKEGIYGEDVLNDDSMFMQTHSIHSFLSTKSTNTRTTKKIKVLQLQRSNDYKTKPCFTHMLDDEAMELTLHTCSWMDVLCPGQHPRETREFINETRREYGLEDLEPEAFVFSELEEDAQLEMCETELENIDHNYNGQHYNGLHFRPEKNRYVRKPHRPEQNSPRRNKDHESMGSPLIRKMHQEQNKMRINEDIIELKATITSLKAQLNLKLDCFRTKYAKEDEKAFIEMMTRNVILETELKHYKEYMETATRRYKADKKRMAKTIKRLGRALGEN